MKDDKQPKPESTDEPELAAWYELDKLQDEVRRTAVDLDNRKNAQQ